MFGNLISSQEGPIISSPFFLGGVLLILVLGALLRQIHVWHRLAHLPGPQLATVTNAQRLKWVLSGRAHDRHVEMHERYGSIARLGPNFVSVADPEAIPRIYGVGEGALKKSDFYRVLSFFVQGRPIPGLFATQDENVHRALRRPIAGMYSMTSVVGYEPHVDRTVKVLFDQLDRRFSGGAVCALDQWLQMFAFDVIGEITFSKRLGFLEKGQDIENIMGNSWQYFRTQAPKTQMPWLDSLWTKNPVVQRVTQAKLNPIVAFAKARRTEKEQADQEAAQEKDSNGTATGPEDFLRRFMEAEKKEGTPPWAVSAWATSNVTAGSDTTAILLRTIFYNLVRTPRAVAALRAEMAQMDLEPGAVVTWKQALGLPYLDAIVKESGRVHPPFALHYERVTRPEGLSVCGKYIPGNTVIGISPWVVHRDREVFGADSHEWRPERWLEADAEGRRKMENTLLTFGAGHRSCIGKNISYLEVYKLVPTFFARYEIDFAEEGCPTWRVENRWFSNQSGLDVRMKRRDVKG